MDFLRDLFHRWWKEIVGGTLVSQLPKLCRWIGEQWAGDRVVYFLNSTLSWLWGWMAGHPLQSLLATTGIIVSLFSIETKIAEKRRLNTAPRASKPQFTPPDKKTAALITPKALSDQFMTMGDDGEQKIQITGVEHPAGILVEVTQILDRDQALSCEVILTDLKKIENGQPHTVPELHKPDGSFKYGRVNLPLGTSHSNLFFNSPQRWWLMQGSEIPYHWGSDKTPGSITLLPGVWSAYLEILAGGYKFNREFTFTWSGSGAAELV